MNLNTQQALESFVNMCDELMIPAEEGIGFAVAATGIAFAPLGLAVLMGYLPHKKMEKKYLNKSNKDEKQKLRKSLKLINRLQIKEIEKDIGRMRWHQKILISGMN